MFPREVGILLYPIHWLHNKSEGVSAGLIFTFGSSPQQGCTETNNSLGCNKVLVPSSQPLTLRISKKVSAFPTSAYEP